MWLYLRHEGKYGRLVDLTASSVFLHRAGGLQVVIHRPFEEYSIKFENESDALSFFEAVVTALKDHEPLIDAAEEGLKFVEYHVTEETVNVFVEGGSITIGD